MNIDKLNRRRVSMMKSQLHGLSLHPNQQHGAPHQSSTQASTDLTLEALRGEYNHAQQKQNVQFQHTRSQFDKGKTGLKFNKSVTRLAAEQTHQSASESGRLLREYIQENFDRCKVFKFYKPLFNYLTVLEHFTAIYEL